MSLADDCEAMLRHLIDKGPSSQKELIEGLGWGYREVNQVLTDLALAGRVRHEASREKGVKVIRYFVRIPR